MDIVSIPKATELLLPSSVPAVEPDLTTVRGEIQWVDFDTNCWFIFLLKFSSEMPLHERSFTRSAIADDDELEAGVIDGPLIRERHLGRTKGGPRLVRRCGGLRSTSP